jgi:hypothetical protein
MKLEGKDPDVEEALSEWFSIATGRGVRDSGPMLNSKSEELAKMLGHRYLKAPYGSLSRRRCRFGIKFMKTRGEKDSAEHWKSTKLSKCADDIYNASETDLLYPQATNTQL